MPENEIVDQDMHQYNHRQGQPVSGLSMAAMICGIVSFPAFCCGILGIPIPIAAIICGHLGIKDLKDNPEKTGKGLAIAGLVLGYLSIVILVGFSLVMLNMDPTEMEPMMKGIMERVTGEKMIMPSEIDVEVQKMEPAIEGADVGNE